MQISATAPFTFGAKPAESSTSSSAAPTITFGSLQPGTAATASPFGSLASLSQAKPAPTATTSGPAASASPFTFGAKPAGKLYIDLVNEVDFRKVRTIKNFNRFHSKSTNQHEFEILNSSSSRLV